ncbi:type I restriction-modification system subunit M [Ureaplasma ceti]|uniref:site-specific DNA-methyltransferase (adenine-specific) n=1 Tax=Ureaplasma ceti TaxID=3119530 RepID=A0ABP9UCC1_9BACT
MNKQQLASKIWESANKMRSKIEANDYKDYILGFIFYKFLSENFTKKVVEELGISEKEFEEQLNEENVDLKEYAIDQIGYFIGYNNLFSTWINKGNDFEINDVRVSISAFNRNYNQNLKRLYENIFNVLDTGLSKLGENATKQTKAARDLIYLIKDIPMNDKQDYDVLGFIYEYLISQFAANAGKKAGEFYTPHEVSKLMSEIVAQHLQNNKEIKIYDPTSGSGSLLINIGEAVEKHALDTTNIQYYAQELKQNTYNLTRMNLIMRGINAQDIKVRNGDTLESDWPFFDNDINDGSYELVRVDAVVSNPPYSQTWDPENKNTDERFANYGLAPQSKADYAFLLHDLYHIKPDGIVTIVLPHGVLFRGGEEGKIRKNLIENNNIDAIIGLPANIFFGTGIPTIVMVLKKNRDNKDVLIIDASKGFIKDGKQNRLQESDIKRIVDTVVYRKEVEKFSRKVSQDEIRENDYNLNIPRYVDSSEAPESYDIYSSMFGGSPNVEINELKEYWLEMPNLKNDLFTPISETHSVIVPDDIKSFITQHNDVKKFINVFETKFNDFDKVMKKYLINSLNNLDEPSNIEQVLSNEIFNRLEDCGLIDPYNVYQLFNNQWLKIAQDLEVIKTEGREVITKVVPNMVFKKNKKDGLEYESQEGWVGKIIPFELAQSIILKEKWNLINGLDNRLEEISSEKNEIFESFTEEDKEELSDVLNEENTDFVSKKFSELVKKLVKLQKEQTFEEDSVEYRILQLDKLDNETKTINKDLKSLKETLISDTKDIIEQLTEEQIHELLYKKWISPIIEAFMKIPHEIIDNFIAQVKALQDKYAETFSDIEKQIEDTEQELIGCLDQLTGSEADMQGLAEFKKLLQGK